jgi:hypothetical protein
MHISKPWPILTGQRGMIGVVEVYLKAQSQSLANIGKYSLNSPHKGTIHHAAKYQN